ncbi:MAG: hypothetical protein CM15mP78_16410 [Candidatus Poseidoniales archaeon]|nr:MAG: hypothetical protein CM15mP78_16410 [Candidatus Poseidoniales archaeon]
MTNDTYKLRARGLGSDSESFALPGGWFNITNRYRPSPPSPFSTPMRARVQASPTGRGSTSALKSTLSFRWGASDDDLKQATLANVPGPGTPPTDGPTSLSYGWDWASGSMQEGTWSPRLTVQDHSGLSNHLNPLHRHRSHRTDHRFGDRRDGGAWQQSLRLPSAG